jgi:trehalose 6-phosphate phosphatase
MLSYNEKMDVGFDTLIETVLARGKSQGLILSLDYDGTLVEIVSWPHLSRPAAGLLATLTRLVALTDLEAIVISGRSLRNLQELLPVPGLHLVGSHGGEGLIQETSWTSQAGGISDEAKAHLHQQLLSYLANCKGWWVEAKTLGLAIHYRQATPENAAEILATLEPFLTQLSEGERFEVLRERKVVEILPGGVSKGEAIRELVKHAGFSHLFPVYIGDDVADASAFQVLRGLGLSIRVGPNSAGADHSLAHPALVRQFLEVLASRWQSQTC